MVPVTGVALHGGGGVDTMRTVGPGAGRQMTATVLIVEDEFNIGRLVRTYLERSASWWPGEAAAA